ncbi:MAG TPA: ABC transporter substrate-binding protein, partial [Actinomycetota bacterium]|nr:ABC transporter substrate-binding protein [Actinomycetota bacterium]
MKFRFAALICLVVMVAAACGARLDANQRKVALQAYAAGGAGGAQPGTQPTAVPSGGVVGGASPGATPSAGASAGGGNAGAAGCAAAAGGNKASDTGVTASQITIGTVSDLSGIQPGLFKSTTDAVSAAAAYMNSQGGICGRQVKAVPYDSQETSSGDKAATQDACRASFALVGSMSAFDDGGASVVDSCGIPDMTAITTNSQRAFADNTYAMYQVRPDQYLQGTARFIKSKYGDAVIKHAAILWLNSGVTKTNASVREKGEEQNGFHFVYKKEVQVVETNYTSYVIQMKDAGVEYVTMVADYQSIIRLCQAMQQQGWYPKVMDWDSVVYSPKFLQQANGAANGSLFFMNTAMLEEAAGNPEMKLYEQWLGRVAPGSAPDYFGLYAWSAARLFQQLTTKIGPDLTRAKLFSALKATHSWDGHGLHAT